MIRKGGPNMSIGMKFYMDLGLRTCLQSPRCISKTLTLLLLLQPPPPLYLQPSSHHPLSPPKKHRNIHRRHSVVDEEEQSSSRRWSICGDWILMTVEAIVVCGWVAHTLSYLIFYRRASKNAHRRRRRHAAIHLNRCFPTVASHQVAGLARISIRRHVWCCCQLYMSRVCDGLVGKPKKPTTTTVGGSYQLRLPPATTRMVVCVCYCVCSFWIICCKMYCFCRFNQGKPHHHHREVVDAAFCRRQPPCWVACIYMWLDC